MKSKLMVIMALMSTTITAAQASTVISGQVVDSFYISSDVQQSCRIVQVPVQVQIQQQQQPAQQADRSVIGPIIGGLTGALVGSRFGGGNGRTAATVIGAVGGTIAGNAIGNSGSAQPQYQQQAPQYQTQYQNQQVCEQVQVPQQYRTVVNIGMGRDENIISVTTPVQYARGSRIQIRVDAN